MNRDFFLETGFEPQSHSPYKLMMPMPEIPIINQYSQFESALFSMTSSPVSSSNQLNLPIIDQFVKENLPRIRDSMSVNPNLPFFPSDPGFAERAAKFSCFGNRNLNDGSHQLGLVLNKTEYQVGSNLVNSPDLKIDQMMVGFEEIKGSDEINMKWNRGSSSVSNSNEGSSVSHQIPIGEIGFGNKKDPNTRKRKGGYYEGFVSDTKKEDDGSKRSKKPEQENGSKIEEKPTPPEPPKDYVHVRARRGEATDSHSLAERVRREKISERMKLLQSLVPNCNKVTGKALMLDEIINYVQSLQRQVELLSMKLATLNPCLDFDTNSLISNVNQSNQNFSQQTSTVYQQKPQGVLDGSNPMTRLVHEFTEPLYDGFGQDDLQSIVRMDFGENLDVDTSFFHTACDQQSNMKIEL